MMIEDMELVRRFARDGSEEAFADLVSRHVHLVYSVALRQVRDTGLAEEITQTVFVILARKAGSLGSRTVVAGWLCRTTRFVSARALTMQRRRQEREQEAFMQSQSAESEADAWKQIEPLLETAMEQLSEQDHNAIVLRFFEGRNFRDAGLALGTSEASAKMRVSRALDKLRAFFVKRGVVLSATLIAGAVSAHSVQAAPVGLVTSIAVTVAKGAAVTSSTTALINTTLKLMAWTKLKTVIVVGTILIVATGTATITLQRRARTKAEVPRFSFAGYATPEASFQSLLWGASTGDVGKFLAGFTTEERERFRNKVLAGKSPDEIRQRAIALAETTAGYTITERETVSDDEVHLHISAPPSEAGMPSGQTVIYMKRIDGEWKRSGGRD
jgi:RNA polymerase sigma factor (sigma-70 family)